MGDGDSSKKVRGGAAESRGTPSTALDTAAPRELSSFMRRVRSANGRIRLCAEIAHRAFVDNPSETEQRNLALALRAIKVADELVGKQALPKQMKELAAQLQADREERARMESGVEFADEGAQLPPVGGDECH